MKYPLHWEVTNRPFLLPFSYKNIYKAEIRGELLRVVGYIRHSNETISPAPVPGNGKAENI